MKTLLNEKIGHSILRIVPAGDGFRGNVTRNGTQSAILEDDDFDRLKARLRNEAGRLHPDYFGIEGAVNRFLSFFPDGFQDPAYLKMEREYKLACQSKLEATLPFESAYTATREQAAEVRRAYYTNLLSQFELARMHAILVGETGPDFVRGAARFTAHDYATGLTRMERATKPHGRLSWAMATYLPNLWRPAEHMFLKPEKTKDFATRVGHPFASDYDATLEVDVYTSLLDLVQATEREISQLEPLDRIDVQSFIWVVGDYTDAQHDEIDQVRRLLRK